MAKIDVTPATLAALKDARPGDTLVMKGAFGAQHYRKRDKLAVGLTFDLTAATLTDWQFTDMEGLAFVGGTINANATHGLRFNRCKAVSVLKTAFVGPAAFEEGKPAALGDGIAFWGIECEDVKVEQSTFSGFKNGCSFSKSRKLVVRQAQFSNMRSDGIQFGECWGALAEDFAIHATRKRSDEHPDGVQCWSRAATGPTSDITIRRFLIVGETQGIGMFGAEGPGYDRIVIEDGEICVGYPQGLCVTNGRGVKIHNVRVRTLPGSRYRASINLPGCSDVKLSGVVRADATATKAAQVLSA